jgi:hypothetical protein
MRWSLLPRVSLALAALLAAWTAGPRAQAPVARVVAVGDVHGSLDGLLGVLRASGLVDASGRWTGGTATLIQTGDVTDRGADVKGVLDLLRRLGAEAAAAGGRVVPILGNHEAMNLVGELRDVTPAICAAFAGTDAEKARDTAWREYEALVRRRSRARRGEQPPALPRTKAAFMAAFPPGCLEYRRALGPDGDYGRWLRTLPIAVKIDRTVFMHAGAPPATTDSLDVLNARAKAEVAKFDALLARLTRANLAAPWFRLEDTLAVAAAEVRWVNARVAEAKARGEAPDLGGVDPALVEAASEVLGVGDWSLLDGDGPLWYRGYAMAEEAALDAPLAGLLARWDADRLVVGHSVTRDFRIRPRLDGRLFLIDTGMLAPVYKGAASALELADGTARALYADGRTDLLVPARR